MTVSVPSSALNLRICISRACYYFPRIYAGLRWLSTIAVGYFKGISDNCRMWHDRKHRMEIVFRKKYSQQRISDNQQLSY
jgi:hypothetical protein